MAAAAFVTDLTEIATQVAEAAAGIGSVLASFKLLDLAKDYYRLYDQQRQFYYNTFQAGVEAPLAQEVYLDTTPVLDYAARVYTAYNNSTGPFGGQSANGRTWWERHAEAYGAAPDPRLAQEYYTDEARVKSDWTNYLFRFEESYYDLRLDIRWRRRIALHNIGIKQGTNVSSSLGDALSGYQSHIADLSSQLATYGNGIARYVGYKRGLADTADDFNSLAISPKTAPRGMTYDSGMAVQVGNSVRGL